MATFLAGALFAGLAALILVLRMDRRQIEAER
jgi:hypothetical protein